MIAITRATAALRELSDHPDGLHLQEIAHRLDIPPGSTHRLLSVLVAEGFAARVTDSKLYCLGPAARKLSGSRKRLSDLGYVGRPHLEQLRFTVGETAFLSRLDGREVVCIALARAEGRCPLFVRLGQPMPPHAAAAARVILAFQPQHLVQQALGYALRAPYTKRTLTEVPTVLRHLQQVRRGGYDVCEDELDRNVYAVAAPIRNADLDVCASVAIAGPRGRFDSLLLRQHLIRHVQLAASSLTATVQASEMSFPGSL